MIGQNSLRNKVDTMIMNGKFPRFTILVGLPGSGRKTMAQYIADSLHAGMMKYSCGVDDMRAMIGYAHKIPSTYVFLISDADNMSPAAKNCILKVVEEPPQDAHFIMTVSDIDSVLDTIKSRGTVLNMDKYTQDEITQFIQSLPDDVSVSCEDVDILKNTCEVPGDVLRMIEYNPSEFMGYVEKVADNLEEVSVANMFKISGKIKLKETQEGYDVRLFWRMFVDICLVRMRKNSLMYGNWIKVTIKKLRSLQITGVNKSMLFDSWLTEIKEIVYGNDNS